MVGATLIDIVASSLGSVVPLISRQAVQKFAKAVGKPSVDLEQRQAAQVPPHSFVGKLPPEQLSQPVVFPVLGHVSNRSFVFQTRPNFIGSSVTQE